MKQAGRAGGRRERAGGGRSAPPLTKRFGYRQDELHESRGPLRNESASPLSRAESERQDGDGRVWPKRGAPRGLWGRPGPCSLRTGHRDTARAPPALWGFSENRHVRKAPGQAPWSPSWGGPTVDVHVALTSLSVFLSGNSSLLQATAAGHRQRVSSLPVGRR